MKKLLFAVVVAALCSTLQVFAQSPLAQAGKIWYDEGFLYVNIVNEGVMVINNYDPTKPRKVGFIEIPGNVDIAVRGTVLYANSHQDLVAIDIQNLDRLRELTRIKDVFRHRPRANTWDANTIAWRNGQELNGLINNWFNVRNMGNVGSIGNNQRIGNFGGLMGGTTFGMGTNVLVANATPTATRPAAKPASTGGKGGSMACFTLKGNYLYAIDARDLLVFDIAKPQTPQLASDKISVSADIETIFSDGADRLFIGSQTGMYIFNASNPVRPYLEGQYRHTRSCDPVVVEGSYAYVTLRDGTDCGGRVNQLDVIDISNPARPQKVKTYPLTNPHGLGIDNGTLFVCDGRDGLKVYDAADPHRLKQTAHFNNINTYDVIPDSQRKILMMVGGNKITQYDYKNPQRLEQLSQIDVSTTTDIQANATTR